MNMRSTAVMVGLALSLVGSGAQAAKYNFYDNYVFNNLGFTQSSYAPGFNEFTFHDQITNLGPGAVLGTVPTTVLLGLDNATYSDTTHIFSAGDETAKRLDDFFVSYADVSIPEPVSAGYVPGGTIPIFNIGYVATNQTVDYDISYIVSDNVGGIGTNFDIVSSVPLPSAAPMFGAALLALGAVGYGMKRKRAAVAA